VPNEDNDRCESITSSSGVSSFLNGLAVRQESAKTIELVVSLFCREVIER
jgi:hypothetical protein